MNNQTSCYLAVLLLLTVGCKTTFHEPKPSDADYKRDLKAAKAYAKAEARKAQFSFGGFGVAETVVANLIGPPIHRAILRKKLIDERMKSLGWEKQSNGKDAKTKAAPNDTQSTKPVIPASTSAKAGDLALLEPSVCALDSRPICDMVSDIKSRPLRTHEDNSHILVGVGRRCGTRGCALWSVCDVW